MTYLDIQKMNLKSSLRFKINEIYGKYNTLCKEFENKIKKHIIFDCLNSDDFSVLYGGKLKCTYNPEKDLVYFKYTRSFSLILQEDVSYDCGFQYRSCNINEAYELFHQYREKYPEIAECLETFTKGVLVDFYKDAFKILTMCIESGAFKTLSDCYYFIEEVEPKLLRWIIIDHSELLDELHLKITLRSSNKKVPTITIGLDNMLQFNQILDTYKLLLSI